MVIGYGLLVIEIVCLMFNVQQIISTKYDQYEESRNKTIRNQKLFI